MIITTKRIIYSAFALTLCIANISQAMREADTDLPALMHTNSSSEPSADNAWMQQWPDDTMLLKKALEEKQNLAENLQKTKTELIKREKELAWANLTIAGAKHLHRELDQYGVNYEDLCCNIANLYELTASLQSKNNALEKVKAQYNASLQDNREIVETLQIDAALQNRNLLIKITELEKEKETLMDLLINSINEVGQLKQKNTKIKKAYTTAISINGMRRNLLTQYQKHTSTTNSYDFSRNQRLEE